MKTIISPSSSGLVRICGLCTLCQRKYAGWSHNFFLEVKSDSFSVLKYFLLSHFIATDCLFSKISNVKLFTLILIAPSPNAVIVFCGELSMCFSYN